VPIGGIVHRRCYTIASAPTQKNYCEITVKREEAGMVSRYLHDFARKGMFLAVSGPGGKFTFSEEDADSLLLIGAGVDITPLMSKIRYLADKMWPGEIRLLYCARTAEEIVFAEELRCLQKSIPSLKVAITLTRESDEKWCGLRGRITPLLLREMLPASTNRRIHICGPVEMADDITNMLREIGVAEEEIQSESFGGSRPAPSIVQGKNSNCAPCIGNATFADSGKSEAIHAGETILEIASSAGVAIDRGCLEGICGRCKVRLLSGEVTMEVDDALGGSDKQQGYVLACQAKPVGRVVIDA
jgi:ferredoxin-NADP reductase